MGFRSLRVMNEDRVAPGQGFGTHGHRDMEIITYVLEGALEHKDSMGNGEVLRPGEFQRMTAGTGIRHSEFNPSPTEPVHLYQIWLLPERAASAPGYEQKAFPDGGDAGNAAAGRLARRARRLADDPPGRPDLLCGAARGQTGAHDLPAGRHAWLQVLRGAVEVNGTALAAGDGAAVSDESASK